MFEVLNIGDDEHQEQQEELLLTVSSDTNTTTTSAVATNTVSFALPSSEQQIATPLKTPTKSSSSSSGDYRGSDVTGSGVKVPSSWTKARREKLSSVSGSSPHRYS
jgi:hypothetical protein